jgi:hypothetical protein
VVKYQYPGGAGDFGDEALGFGSLARVSQLRLTTLRPYALGEDAGSRSGAFQLCGLPIPGRQFCDLPGRVICDAGQASIASLIS